MNRPTTRAALALTLAAAALLATGCSGSSPQPTPAATSTPAKTTETSTPVAEPTATAPAETAGDPTCETIISQTTVNDFTSLGLSALADPFQAGSVLLPDGVVCVWGDIEAASDHVQIFGWAAATSEQAEQAIADLTSQGWTRIDGADGVYVTQPTDQAVATDADGFGLTYLFGHGWVKYADTKQGLLLVDFPQT